MINAILLDHEQGIVSQQLIFNCRLEIFLCPTPAQRIAPSKICKHLSINGYDDRETKFSAVCQFDSLLNFRTTSNAGLEIVGNPVLPALKCRI